MQPNLARIPPGGDVRAEAILRRAPRAVTRRFLGSLDDRDALALARYGARLPTTALRANSPELLRDGLLATGISEICRESDPRDLMIDLALYHLVGQRLGQLPSALFDDIASRLPDGAVPDLLRMFGARQDITLEAFGWQEVQTADGPDFVPVL
jgi:hypothetical protein